MPEEMKELHLIKSYQWGRKTEGKKEIKKDETDVSTDVDYGVASFSSWSKSI